MTTLRIAAIAGPLVWIVQMAIDFTFAWPNCVNGKVWMLVIVNIAAMLIAAAGALTAARLRPVEPFRATIIAAIDAIFALLILAQTMPLLLFRGCA